MRRVLYSIAFLALAWNSPSAYSQSNSSGPEGASHITAPTPTPTVPPPPTVVPTPTPRNRICRGNPDVEVQCGPGTNVGVNYKVICTSIDELFRAMAVVAPEWIPYWRNVENWIPWIDLGGEVRAITNWRTTTDPAQYEYATRGYFWTDINGYYDPGTGNLIRSGVDNRDVSHCVTTNNLLCGCGRNNDEGCFPPGVKITMSDHSTKLVEDVVAGDYVWNPVQRRAQRVVRVVEGPEERALVVVHAGGSTLKMSQEHPVRVHTANSSSFTRVALSSSPHVGKDINWSIKQARDITRGDLVSLEDGTLASVTAVEEEAPEEGLYVINFILDADSNSADDRMLLADGIVTGDLVVQQEIARSRAR